MTLIIRQATLSDAEDISRIASITFSMACHADTPQADVDSYIASDLSADSFRDLMARSATAVFVASFDANIVGYILLSDDELPNQIEANKPIALRRIYVLPEFHGTSVADGLMNHAINAAVSHDYDCLLLGVAPDNQRALAFYRKHAFRNIGHYEFRLNGTAYQGYLLARVVTEAIKNVEMLGDNDALLSE